MIEKKSLKCEELTNSFIPVEATIERLKKEQTELQQQLTDIFILNHSILSDFEWTFTINQHNP